MFKLILKTSTFVSIWPLCFSQGIKAAIRRIHEVRCR